MGIRKNQKHSSWSHLQGLAMFLISCLGLFGSWPAFTANQAGQGNLAVIERYWPQVFWVVQICSQKDFFKIGSP